MISVHALAVWRAGGHGSLPHFMFSVSLSTLHCLSESPRPGWSAHVPSCLSQQTSCSCSGPLMMATGEESGRFTSFSPEHHGWPHLLLCEIGPSERKPYHMNPPRPTPSGLCQAVRDPRLPVTTGTHGSSGTCLGPPGQLELISIWSLG